MESKAPSEGEIVSGVAQGVLGYLGVLAGHPVSYSGHVLSPSYSGLDEVIFSYVLGVLEDLGPSGPSEENFDMESFIEMMEAYVPGFAHIPRLDLAKGRGQLAVEWDTWPLTTLPVFPGLQLGT